MIDGKDKARIEAAIRVLDDWYKAHPIGCVCDPKEQLRTTANLCRYFLGQPQDTWKNEDFGLKEEKK